MRRPFPSTVSVLFFLIFVGSAALHAPVTEAGAHAASAKPIKTWTCMASWYGPGFHGRTTASGQPYDMYAATAAHPWLPLGSIVRVINLATGESGVARINDRGPYISGRELDVSYMLAGRLGMLEPGTASVRIELLEEPQRHSQTP